MTIIASLPTQQLLDDVRAALDPTVDAELVLWQDGEPAPAERIDIVVPPYMRQGGMLRALAEVEHRLIQGQAIGYEGVDALLTPGDVYANATGVHETATAELAVGLMIAGQRGFGENARNQANGVWHQEWTPGLADRRVLLLGYGGVAKAIAARLAGFEVELVPVASRAREEDGLHVHGIDELPELLPTADILVNVLPGGAATAKLIDDAALSALPNGALVVNVGRGPTVDTDALVDHVRRGRIRVASDVFDPEPLPEDHPLWRLDGVFITPHNGGRSGAMRPRIARLIARQIERMARGEEPLNVVIRT